MKKILVSFSLILFTLTGFSQVRKVVKLDSVVSVSMPADYRKIDTLGQQTYTANSQYGYIIINRAPNPPGNKTLKKEKDLNNVFKEYIRKVQSSLKDGNIINDHDTIINKLEVRDFTLKTDTGSGVQLRQFRILYTKPVTYTFQYLYDEGRQDVAAKEIKAFYNNIKIARGLDGTDQFTMFGQSQGITTTALVLIIVGIVIIIYVVLVVRKKRKNDMLINDILND